MPVPPVHGGEVGPVKPMHLGLLELIASADHFSLHILAPIPVAGSPRCHGARRMHKCHRCFVDVDAAVHLKARQLNDHGGLIATLLGSVR